MKKSKLLVMALAIALLLTSAFCIISAADEEATTKPVIISKNIAYEGNFALVIAIDANTVTSGSVTVEVFDEDATTRLGSYTSETTKTITIEGVETEAYLVKTAGIASKEMAKQYYFRAIDGTNVGDLARYSVGEYFYERTYLCESTPSQLELYDYSLKMGAAAQKVLVNEKNGDTDTTNDETLVTDYSLVKITGGLLSDGYAQGIYANGTELTLVPASGTEAWKITNLADGSYTTTDSNTLIVSNHVSIESGELEFKLGSGVYYNGTAEGSENFNAVIYDYDSGSVADYVNSASGNTYLNALVNGQLSSSWLPHDSSSGYYYIKGNEVISETHVFETDIYFSKGTVTSTDYNIGFTGFTGSSTGNNKNMSTQFYLNAIPGDAADEGYYIAQVGMGTGEGTSDNLVTFDTETWYNLRIVASLNADEAKYYVDIYVNNTLVCENRGVSGGGSSDLTGKNNGWAVYARRQAVTSDFAVTFDNTFLGSYETPYVKGSGDYYNMTEVTDYTYQKWDFSSTDGLFTNGETAVTVADGELSDTWGKDASRFNLKGVNVSGNKHILETDIYFDAAAATALSSTDANIGWMGFTTTSTNNNQYMFANIYINAIVDSEDVITGIGLSNKTAATDASGADSTNSQFAKLELGKWYNFRMEMEIAEGYVVTTKIYINNNLVCEGVNPANSVSATDINQPIASFGAVGRSSKTTSELTVKFDNMFYGTIPAETSAE